MLNDRCTSWLSGGVVGNIEWPPYFLRTANLRRKYAVLRLPTQRSYLTCLCYENPFSTDYTDSFKTSNDRIWASCSTLLVSMTGQTPLIHDLLFVRVVIRGETVESLIAHECRHLRLLLHRLRPFGTHCVLSLISRLCFGNFRLGCRHLLIEARM